MSEDKNIRQLANKLSVPENLEDKIRSNWERQLAEDDKSVSDYRKPVGFGIAASFFVALSVLMFFTGHDDLASHVYADIEKDANLMTGISTDQIAWLKNKKVNFPLEKFNIEMAKDCNIDGVKTLHVRVADEKNKKVNFFVYDGSTPLQEKFASSENTSNWKVIQRDENLTILVVPQDDAASESVQKLIGSISYT